MSTQSITLKPQTMSGLGFLLRLFSLTALFVISGLVLTQSYMAANYVLFAGLLLFILLGVKKHQGRNLMLLIYVHLVVMVSIFNVAVVYPGFRDLTAEYTGETIFGINAAIILLSLLLGITGAFFLVTVPFFMITAFAAWIIYDWYKHTGVSYWETFLHLLRVILGVGYFSVIIEGEEVKGAEDAKRRLEIFGGPGWLIVYPGQVVVLYRYGKITRVVGMGSTMLKQGEKIKGVVPLGTKGNAQTVENVLTRDKITLNLTLSHAVQIESAQETRDRLDQAVKEAQANVEKIKASKDVTDEDKKTAEQNLIEARKKRKDLDNNALVGDDDRQCYVSIVKSAATDVWGALKGPVANNLRDVIMSEYFEELFQISGNEDDLKTRIDQRKIAEVERIVLDKAKQAKLKDGLVLKAVDISKVSIPEALQKKINEEIEVLIEERIQKTKARIEESRAKGSIVAARAKAQARALEGQGEGEAQARLFREILTELNREDVLRGRKNEITQSILNLISSTTSVKEIKNFLETTNGLQPKRYRTITDDTED